MASYLRKGIGLFHGATSGSTEQGLRRTANTTRKINSAFNSCMRAEWDGAAQLWKTTNPITTKDTVYEKLGETCKAIDGMRPSSLVSTCADKFEEARNVATGFLVGHSARGVGELAAHGNNNTNARAARARSKVKNEMNRTQRRVNRYSKLTSVTPSEYVNVPKMSMENFLGNARPGLRSQGPATLPPPPPMGLRATATTNTNKAARNMLASKKPVKKFGTGLW